MKTSKSISKTSWNADRAVGRKTGFTKPQTEQIEHYPLQQQNWHDLAMMSFALDGMLRSSDVLKASVGDVTYPSGFVRSEVRLRQQKTDRNVYPELGVATQTYLRIWIEISGKEQDHLLFTRSKPNDAPAISRGHYANIIKTWAEWLGLPPEEYSTHSMRRSKPAWMYDQGEPIELLAELLGHKSTEVTLTYLGINQKKAAAAARRHPMMKGPTPDQLPDLCKNSSDLLGSLGGKTVKLI